MVALSTAGILASAFGVSLPAGAATSDLISGTVRDATGQPDTGALVKVIAWPNSTTLAALPLGATVPTTTLATGHANSVGKYALNPDLSSLDPATYKETGGAVQLEVELADIHGRHMSTEFSAASPTSTDALDGGVASVSHPETVTFNIQTHRVGVGTGTAPPQTYPSTVVDLGSLNAPDDYYCLPYKKTRKVVRNERFYNLYAYGRSTVEEVTGSAHKIEVGTNFNYEGWTASADVTIDTKTSSGGIVPYKNNHTLYNAMNVAKFDHECYSTSGGAAYHEAKAEAVSFNELLVASPHIENRKWNPSWCKIRHKGDWWKSAGRDQTFSAGLGTPWIGLSVQAAYSKSMQVDWHPPRAGEYLCGSNNNGFASAPFGGGYAAEVGCSVATQNIAYTDGSLAALTAEGGTVDDYSNAPAC